MDMAKNKMNTQAAAVYDIAIIFLFLTLIYTYFKRLGFSPVL